jgi:hypothetical protein
MAQMSDGPRLSVTFRIEWRHQKGQADSTEKVGRVNED